jgi:hypothetical protein
MVKLLAHQSLFVGYKMELWLEPKKDQLLIMSQKSQNGKQNPLLVSLKL